MKNFKFNFFLIAALLVTIVTVSAFTLMDAPLSDSKPPSTWVFTGTSSEIMVPEKWNQTETLPQDCDEIGDSPCSISVQADNRTELGAFFTGKDEDDILLLSPDRRP